jgi:copper chaperone
MALKLTVANIQCSDCAETITEAIKIHAPNAKVNVEAKTVTIEPAESGEAIASEESIKQAITAAGYQIV